MVKWLRWDGVYVRNGKCNHTSGGGTPSPSSSTTQVVDVARGPSSEKNRLGSTLDERPGISVRLEEVGVDLVPFRDVVRIKLKIEFTSPIQSLLLRVYRNFDKAKDKDKVPASDRLVYQEILKGDQLQLADDNVPEPALDDDEAKRLRALYGFGNGWAHPADGPYKVKVWVATKDDAFDVCVFRKKDDAVNDPTVVDRECVHDQHEKPDEDAKKPKWTVEDKAGINLATFCLPLLRVGMVTPYTSDELALGEHIAQPKAYPTSRKRLVARWDKQDGLKRHKTEDDVIRIKGVKHYSADGTQPGEPAEKSFWVSYNIDHRVDFLFHQIDQVLGQFPAPPGGPELRIVLAPEWFFSRSGQWPITKSSNDTRLFAVDSLPPYSYHDVAAIIQKVRARSAAGTYAGTLIVPGSILWGVPVPAPPGVGRTDDDYGSFNTAIAVMNGQLLHLHHKQVEGSDTRWGHAFMMDPRQVKPNGLRLSDEERNRLYDAQTTFFYCNGVSFALDICAELSGHPPSMIGIAKGKYTARFTEGRGVDVHMHVSAGAPGCNEKNTVARINGLHLNCDALEKQIVRAAFQGRAAVFRITKRDDPASRGSAEADKRRDEATLHGGAIRALQFAVYDPAFDLADKTEDGCPQPVHLRVKHGAVPAPPAPLDILRDARNAARAAIGRFTGTGGGG